MNNVEFNEDQYTGQRIEYSSGKTSWFVNLILKTGITRNETTASYILLGLAIVILVVSFFLFSQANKTPKVENSPDLHLDYV